MTTTLDKLLNDDAPATEAPRRPGRPPAPKAVAPRSPQASESKTAAAGSGSPPLEPVAPSVVITHDAITEAIIRAGEAGPRSIDDYEEGVQAGMFDESLPKTMISGGREVEASPDAMPKEIWSGHKHRNYMQPVTRQKYSEKFGGPMPDHLFGHEGIYSIGNCYVFLIPTEIQRREKAESRRRHAEKTIPIFRTSKDDEIRNGGLIQTKAEIAMVDPHSVDQGAAQGR